MHVRFALAEVADVGMVGLLAHRREQNHQGDSAETQPQQQRPPQLAQLGSQTSEHHVTPVTFKKRCSSEVRSLSTDSG
jgi:hypothetical protein